MNNNNNNYIIRRDVFSFIYDAAGESTRHEPNGLTARDKVTIFFFFNVIHRVRIIICL